MGTSSRTDTWVIPTSEVIRMELRSFELELSGEEALIQHMDFTEPVSPPRIVCRGVRDTLSALVAFVVLILQYTMSIPIKY
jgi:hypothetical protein